MRTRRQETRGKRQGKQVFPGQCICLGFLLFFLLGNSVLAHDARPVVVTISEQLPLAYQFSIRVPESVEQGNMPAVAWPANCSAQILQSSPGFNSGSVICGESLFGQSLSLDYPFFNPSLATFYRLEDLAGSSVTAMLTPMDDGWAIPEEATAGGVAREYLALGIEHILGGFDHLLFVLGLLVIARTLKRILWTVTGFTLAHSITLSLSALGFVTIPIVPVEAVIALSIVFLAYEISREAGNTWVVNAGVRPHFVGSDPINFKNRQSLTYQYPLIVSFGFGLLHGLGFASALGEIGLVPNEILVSLLFFNLGVEAGQVAFILVFCAGLWLLKLAADKQGSLTDVITARKADMLAAYVIGIPASYWLIERVASFLI